MRTAPRVTDYGVDRGKPLPRQTIIQAGTAVFVDRTAVPRIRCVSGDPLAEPQAVTHSPLYRGTAWPAFRPTTVVGITPTPTTTLIPTHVPHPSPFPPLPPPNPHPHPTPPPHTPTSPP